MSELPLQCLHFWCVAKLHHFLRRPWSVFLLRYSWQFSDSLHSSEAHARLDTEYSICKICAVLSSNVYTFSIIFADLLHPIPSFSCIGRLESTLLPGRWDVGGVIQELAKYIGGNSWLARTEVARPMEAHVVGKAALFAWTTAWSTIHARQADPNVGPSKWLERWMRCITL